MREVMGYLRYRGFQSVCYLDDILCIGDTCDQCMDNVNETLKLLNCLGFVVNYDKSNLIPRQSCKFLGFVYHTKSLSISLSPDKRVKITELVTKFTKLPPCSIREFARLIGILVAACPAAKYAWMYTKILERQKYLALLKHVNYEAKIKLSDNLLDDLRWWSSNIDTTSNFMRQPNFQFEIYSDASRTGWGAVCKNEQRSTSLAQTPYPGCREALRQSFIRKGAGLEATKLMLASFSDSTVKQYNTSLKLWWQYCSESNTDAFEPSKTSILAFLTTQFNNGCGYGSLNSHRSALSAFIGNNIGSDECVKGAYRSKPIKGKYSSTWNPQKVLNVISGWFPNAELSLEKITKKLVILLALCTGHRIQTLSLIKLHNILISESGIKILITDIIKTSAPSRDQPILYLPYFRENTSICPATVLSDYISKTRNIRPEGIDKLLLTHKQPHKAATTQSISRWIKQVLSESGVDISVFGAHSTRHASTSAASAAGINIETIRKTAGWTSSSHSFARFYNRVVLDEGEFARSVCLRNP
ncbi:jg17276 [Pararge aegeria aegeria]|uniref:Jg17276 protein n=1 Tax=Pararge aegeria aegeria TaxID=348720 RepID=A0A8S4R0W9_9NEOP|nr:jg17276 [Pararge aegeria aegeria]